MARTMPPPVGYGDVDGPGASIDSAIALWDGTLGDKLKDSGALLSAYSTAAQVAAAYQPLDPDLTAIAALSTTSYGRSFLAVADGPAGRTLLGLGTLATQSGTFSGTSSGTNTGDQTITMSGDASGSGTGAITVTLATVPIAKGGTGATTKAAGYDALSPLTTLGDLPYGGAAGTGTRLAGNTTATRKFVISLGNGSVAAAPTIGILVAGDIPDISATYAVVADGAAAGLAAHTLSPDVKVTGATTVTTTFTTGTAQPASITDAVMSGYAAGGNETGTGTLGTIASSLASDAAEQSTGSGQAGLGSTAATDQPYNSTDFAGGRVPVALVKSNGQPPVLLDMLTTANVTYPLSIGQEVYCYLVYRSDKGANLKWRLWYYFQNAVNGLETSFTPNFSLTNTTVRIPVVKYQSAQSLAERRNQPVFSATAAEVEGATATSRGVLTLAGVLSGTADVPTLAANAVTDAYFRQGVARSIVGVTGNATANTADIQGAADQVLRVNGAGTALAFGAIDLSKAAAATGVLQAACAPAHTGDVTSSAGAVALTIANDAVTYAKMQNVSATDKILGRSTAGAGDVEEIACTSQGRDLLDDTSTSAQRTTLGVAIGTNVEAWDATLDALAAYNTNGILCQTAADTFAGRTITGSAGITVTNGGGVAGAPALASTRPGRVVFVSAFSAYTQTNLASAITELQVGGGLFNRHSIDLSAFTQARGFIFQGAAAASGSNVGWQYSTDSGSTWTYLDGQTSSTAIASTVPYLALSTSTNQVLGVGGTWQNLAAGAKADVLLRCVSSGGDGVADPTFSVIVLEFK